MIPKAVVKFELAAILYLMMKKKIGNELQPEEQDTNKLGKFCSERKVCGRKCLATLCLSGRRMYGT